MNARSSKTIQTEALIVGAGPCGLFQVFELGLQGISAHIVEALPYPGGQCAELYPDKPIYDIPAIPVCSAIELVKRLEEQIEPFNATFHLNQLVSEVVPTDDLTFLVTTSAGTEFETQTVIIAGGVGSFQPMPLRVDGVEEHIDKQVFYRLRDTSVVNDRDVVILGGGDSALDWTIDLIDRARSLTLIHRSEKFRAMESSVQKMQEFVDAGRMRFMVGNATGLATEDDRITGIHVTQPIGDIEELPCDRLLVFFGLSPTLGPIAEWGLELDRHYIVTDTEKFETNVPGIYAIGDIAVYPGKRKLILSGFHEAALAAFAIKQRLNPGQKVFLQYTTTSPIMHQRLGVDGNVK